jgi:hypothetical protein
VPAPPWRALVAPAVLTIVLLYAALLRFDALFKTYGPYEAPRWLAALQPLVAAAAPALTPDWKWRHVATPYVGGDPINYLKFAREMRSFYAAHVREPMFPAMTKLGLAATADADVGVSITSMTFSLLSLVATYALGALLGSPFVGLASAAMLGIDQDAVHWSIEGWRDELFAFFAVACAWAWIRLARVPTRRNAILAGAFSGGACLTRITTFSLIAPAIIWLIVTRGGSLRRELAIAVAVMAVIVAPFLINCFIATGDALYAINNHTDFYLKREGEVDPSPISAVRYSVDKFESRPIAATDNAVRGVFVYPFSNKWVGLDRWYPGLGRVLACLAIAGLIAWLWSPDGRLVLIMFLGSLVPFSMTWTVIGGAEWRLTLFAYSFYLIAAFSVVDGVARFARDGLDSDRWKKRQRPFRRNVFRPAAVVLALVAVAGVWYFAAPYAVVREALMHGDAAMIAAGSRDRWFFFDGWADPVIEGNVTTRAAANPSATLRIVLPEARSYQLIVRVDPVSPPTGSGQIVQLSMNGHPLENMVLGWNPERIGRHDVTIPGSLVVPGVQHLGLRSDARFKLWYVRVAPQ